MKILITGSHFTPAQATIEQLQKTPDVEIVYVGRKRTMEGDKTLSVESQILPSLGVKFISLTTGRFRRSFDLLTIWSLCKIPFGLLQSLYVVAREDPDVILSFGGYVSVPIVVSGWLLSKKIIVHEQTLVSGLANKITSVFADKIAVSFDKEYEFKKEKIVLTGNPIRGDLLITKKLTKEIEDVLAVSKKDKLPVIFITGGNQGSYTINRVVVNILNNLTRKYVVIHQCGDSKYGDFEMLIKRSNEIEFPNRYFVSKWIDSHNFGGIIKRSQLVISRAGANTLTELAFFKIPALVIPLMGLYKNEQMVNARFFEKHGLVKVLPQSELNDKRLLEEINKILKQTNKLKSVNNSSSLVILDAAKRLALETLILGENQ